jgi:hypothetical protein
VKASGSASIEILGAELARVFRLRMLPIIVGRPPSAPATLCGRAEHRLGAPYEGDRQGSRRMAVIVFRVP